MADVTPAGGPAAPRHRPRRAACRRRGRRRAGRGRGPAAGEIEAALRARRGQHPVCRRREHGVKRRIDDRHEHESGRQDPQLARGIGAGSDELRQEGDEKHDALRVEGGHQPGIGEEPPARARRGRRGNFRGRDAAAQEPDAEVDQIQAARRLQHRKPERGACQHGAQAQQRERERRRIAQRHGRHQRHIRAPAMRQRVADHGQDGRAGYHQQQRRRRDKGRPEFEGHAVSPWP